MSTTDWSGRRSLRRSAGNGVRPPEAGARGYSLPELLAVLAIIAALAAVAVPSVAAGLGASKTRGAAYYVSSRFALARTLAVQRHANVALRFRSGVDGIRMGAFVDGNDNGVLAADIARGVDRAILPEERLDHLYGGVAFGFVDGARLIDGSAAGPDDDPIRFGRSDMLVFSPAGTATSGTVYIRGRDQSQYAVVVLGATGRTRIARFDQQTGRWVDP